MDRKPEDEITHRYNKGVLSFKEMLQERVRVIQGRAKKDYLVDLDIKL